MRNRKKEDDGKPDSKHPAFAEAGEQVFGDSGDERTEECSGKSDGKSESPEISAPAQTDNACKPVKKSRLKKILALTGIVFAVALIAAAQTRKKRGAKRRRKR
jgi:hypothetical protein